MRDEKGSSGDVWLYVPFAVLAGILTAPVRLGPLLILPSMSKALTGGMAIIGGIEGRRKNL